MEITLTKVRTYKLEPYGRFVFKWKKPRNEKPHQIYIGGLHIKYDTAMPMSKEQEDAVIKLMKKHKTDVLTNGCNFFTRTNDGLTEIWHEKIMKYGTDPAFKDAVDSAEAFR